MRSETTVDKVNSFMQALASRTGEGRIYFTGGASALIEGWRNTTIDIDLKAEPEPSGFFEALATLKDELDVNVELASPDQFIPPIPQWRENSRFICRHGRLDYYHYDFVSQALAKIERGHRRDLLDVKAMLDRGLVNIENLKSQFEAIEKKLIRYPAIDPQSFRHSLLDFCNTHGKTR